VLPAEFTPDNGRRRRNVSEVTGGDTAKKGLGMKNVWKGMTVGAFAGALVGVIMDVVEGTGRRAAEVSARAATGVSTRARSGATHLAEFVEEKIDEWDVKDKVDQVKGGVEHGLEQAKDVSARAASEASTRAKSGAAHMADLVEDKIDEWDVKDKVDQVKGGVEDAVDKGKETLKRN
jgi:hypothetical protein